jgi:hypothetical protein
MSQVFLPLIAHEPNVHGMSVNSVRMRDGQMAIDGMGMHDCFVMISC